jgi:hypothetical protein
MPEYRFKGDPRTGHGPESIEFGGYKIGRNLWTPVGDAALVAKLDGHSHFERKAGEAKDAEAEKTSEVDGGGQSLRDYLLAKAETLGVVVDGRWGVSRLQSEVDAAEAAQQSGGA